MYVWYSSPAWDAHIPFFLLTLFVYLVAAPCRWALRDGTVPSSVQLCSRRLESLPHEGEATACVTIGMGGAEYVE